MKNPVNQRLFFVALLGNLHNLIKKILGLSLAKYNIPFLFDGPTKRANVGHTV